MGKLNVEPIMTFADGSQLLVSTQYTGTGGFSCELYLSTPCERDKLDLRVVSANLEAPTCREAHEGIFHHAQRQFPNIADAIKQPPYLIWPGPHLPLPPDTMGRRQRRARG